MATAKKEKQTREEGSEKIRVDGQNFRQGSKKTPHEASGFYIKLRRSKGTQLCDDMGEREFEMEETVSEKALRYQNPGIFKKK